MAIVCAYCGRPRRLSREHLFPAWLYERTREYGVQYHAPAPDKLVSGEQKIGDVCRTCNSGSLSTLDGYVRQVYDTYFARVVRDGESVQFSYDYDQLARWLLKISYNHARANRASDVQRLAECSTYILHGHPRPQHLAVFVRLIIPQQLSQLAAEEQQAVQAAHPGITEMLPLTTSIAVGQPSGYSVQFDVCRRIELNSYQFFLLIADESMRSQAVVTTVERERALDEFQEDTPGAVLLTPNANSILLNASSVTVFDVVNLHILKNYDLYNAAFGQ